MAITIALAGNPNAGKTTLFNQLTGSNQYVGNWPGVTVEKKEGKLRGHKDVTIADLPGIYSLSPYTLEEVVARNYLINNRPDAIMNIVDGTNLERNLYLSTQLKELGVPVIMAINMMDVVEKNGDVLNLDALGQAATDDEEHEHPHESERDHDGPGGRPREGVARNPLKEGLQEERRRIGAPGLVHGVDGVLHAPREDRTVVDHDDEADEGLEPADKLAAANDLAQRPRR